MMQCESRNLSMLLDLYELTMANGFFLDHRAARKTTFDLFYRKNPDGGGYAVFAGLEQAIDQILGMRFEEEDIAYLRSLKLFPEEFLGYLRGYRFQGDVTAAPEGTIVFPNEPIVTVSGSLLDTQLVETALLNQVNHQSLIATKASRIVRAADGRGVSDCGARRAHTVDSAVYGARAAYIGGVDSTATVMAGELFGIPVTGTMAHSWVMYYGDELEAFRKYAETYPDSTVLLVDTYDVLKSGVPNAIRVAHDVLEPAGHRLRGIRLDSGDLAYLSKRARAMLDAAGLEDCKIIASNSLDEWTVRSLIEQGARIDSFGVGERLITAKSDPVFGAVYKLVATEEGGACIPRIKLSETPEKITNPGRKRLYRVFDETGHAVADLIAKREEALDFTGKVDYIDPKKPWRKREFTGCAARELHRDIIKDGRLVCEFPSLKEIRGYVAGQLRDEIWCEEQRMENPHAHYLDMTPPYYQMKLDTIDRETLDAESLPDGSTTASSSRAQALDPAFASAGFEGAQS